MPFKNNLKIEKIGSQKYILTENLIYEDDKYQLIVKAGFDFDAISIPKIFWSIVGSPFTGNAVRAATAHDALYASQWLPKKECDEIFYNAMIADGVSKITAWSMYQAVKWFGRWAYEDVEELEKYRNLVIVGVMK